MSELNRDYADGLWINCHPPCLSLYQPTHRYAPGNQQDPIRFVNLVRELEESLLQQFAKDEIQQILEPFQALAKNHDFWNHSLDGLAVLAARGMFRVYKLQRPVDELAVVADSFHIKPLLRILQSADRYQILGLSRKQIKLFEGNRDALDEIEPAQGVPRTMIDALGEELTVPSQTVASYGGVGVGHSPIHHGHGGGEPEVDIDAERFFRAVDRAIMTQHSQPSGLPLILAALPEHHHMFHSVSHNPFLMRESINSYPDSLSSIAELRQRAWQLMEPHYLARLDILVEEFGNAKADDLGDDDLTHVAKAVVGGRVSKLLIEACREVPGRINTETGNIEMSKLSNPKVNDILDDLGRLTLTMHGQVVVVPSERMPTKSGIAAIYRY